MGPTQLIPENCGSAYADDHGGSGTRLIKRYPGSS